MVTTIIALSIIVLILGFTTYNLLIKNEKCEDVITSQDEKITNYEKYMQSFSEIINTSSIKLKELDVKGIFEADDEVGDFFKTIKSLQEQLNNFKV